MTEAKTATPEGAAAVTEPPPSASTEVQPIDLDLLAKALQLAYDLIDHGVPVVVCKPNPRWTGGPDDMLPPPRWHRITAQEARPLLADFTPGVDALAMVGGHGVDVVDVDTKAEGSVDNLPPFRYFGVHTTPSGGRHYPVRSTGIGKISPLTTSAGHVGDYIGGTPDGGSRMLAFLPGSTRRKYPGKGYGIEQRVDLDELFDCDPDDELASALIEANGSRDGKPGKQAAKLSEVRSWLSAHGTPGTCTYGRTAIAGMLAKAPTTPGGRHGWHVAAVVRTVELAEAGCCSAEDFHALTGKLREIKPEGGTDPVSVLAWSIVNAAGSTGCQEHNPEARVNVHEITGTTPGQKLPPRPVSADAPSPPLSPDQVALDFWDARPVLRHLHDFARARMVAPLAVLGVALARVVAATPPAYVLPPTIGGPGTLNFFLALVGPSGGGKGAALAAGDDALDLSGFRDGIAGTSTLHSSDVGSGEGVVHQYARWEGKEGVKQYRESVLFTVPEVDQLTAVGSRQGSTLMPILRKAYSGEALSFAYADPTKRLHLRGHAYRMALVAGVQPGRAAALLDDADGGTPQRFLWLPVTDPTMPRDRPAQPEPWTVPVPPASVGRAEVQVCNEATDEITEAHWRRSRGDGDALDGHALYTRLKVAAALAVLDGHLGTKGVTSEDWRLAGLLMAISDDTRAKVQAELRRTSAQANKARAEAEGVREIVKADTVEAAGVQKAGRAVMAVLGKQPGQWVSGADLRRKVPNRVRPYLDAAIDALVLAGSVDSEDVEYHGRSGRRFRGRL
jgi:hypothetical protein